MGEILKRVGLEGLDRKIIEIRAQEAEKRGELEEGKGKDVDEELLITPMEKTQIEAKEPMDT